MAKNSFLLFKEAKFWKEQWKEKAIRYLKGKPILGMLIEELILNNTLSGVKTICEIAAGSARDSLYLGKNISVVATDKYNTAFEFSKEFAIKMRSNTKFQQEDAFKLTFPDNSFDLVFHNGFFILFPDNKEIINLLREQIRITKKYIMIVVHNKWDFYSRLRIKHFAKKGDPLFDFRWWNLRELKRFAKPFGKIVLTGGVEVKIIKEIQSYKHVPTKIKKAKLWNWKGWKKILPCERIFLILEIFS